jgi:uncharacterized protein
MSAAHAVPRLDPRGPFVLDTRELGRRAGSMRAERRTVAAPDGWGLELVEVPAGSDVTLDLRLEAVMDGVLVSGAVHAAVRAECGRCLGPVDDAIDVDVQELFAYDEMPGEEDVATLSGDFIDFEPVVRDAVVLALPLNPVCAEDCRGLCPGCGERLADLPAGHTHDSTDPRWAALASLTTPDVAADEPPATPEIGS